MPSAALDVDVHSGHLRRGAGACPHFGSRSCRGAAPGTSTWQQRVSQRDSPGVLCEGLASGADVSMLHNGLSARAAPTATEAILVRNARHLAIPANARNEHNPVTPSKG